MILALINGFIVPYDIAFNNFDSKHDYSHILIVSSDIFFVFDVILTFFVSFKNKKGQEIKKPNEIAKEYIVSWFFVIDVAPLLGSIDNNILKSLSLLKVLRLKKLRKILINLNLTME
jgi:hypothetical protein